MYINRRQTLLIFSILYTLLCSRLKKPPLVTLRSCPHVCGERALSCPPPAQSRGVREGVAPPDQSTWAGKAQATAVPSEHLGKELGMSTLPARSTSGVCPSASWVTSTTELHHGSINLRSLKERKGDTFKSQRLTELPEARKRQHSNLMSRRGPFYTAYPQDRRRTILLDQMWCPP